MAIIGVGRDLVKSRRREIGSSNYRIALTFYRHMDSTAADVPVKFQSDRKIQNINPAASRLCEILQSIRRLIVELGPRCRSWSMWSVCPVLWHSQQIIAGRSSRHESPVTWLFVQNYVYVRSKDNKAPYCWSFVRGIYRWTTELNGPNNGKNDNVLCPYDKRQNYVHGKGEYSSTWQK